MRMSPFLLQPVGTQAALHAAIMNDNFTNAMNRIVGQAEAERQEELRMQKRAAFRAKIFGHVRGVFVLLFVAALLVGAYNYRDRLTALFAAKPKPEITAQGSASLNAAQKNAATRDNVIAEVTK
jgi:hypothetical protein